MKREQIIEILEKYKDIECWYFFGQESEHKALINLASPENIADEILALPLDVPSDDEVKKHMIEMNLYQHLDEFDNDVWDEGKLHWAIQGYKIAAKWMRDEIIKRNK